MPSLSHLEWLTGQVPFAQFAARLRLDALRDLYRTWDPKPAPRLEGAVAFRGLSDREKLCAAFESAGLSRAVSAEAETVLDGTFTLFGGFPLKAETGIPHWLAAFPQGPPWTLEHSFDIDISGWEGRDIRFTWELSRHGDLVTLARAWCLSGDARCAERLEALLADWIEKNPFLRGPNWTSALEVAIRAIAWAFIDDAAGEAFVRSGFGAKFAAALFLHGLYVDRFLSAGLSPSHHIIGEAAGLFVTGTKFRRMPQGRRWRARAARILEHEVRRQTFPSGASRAQSIACHRFVTGLFALCTALDGPRVFSERYSQRLRAMYGFLNLTARPDGSFTDLGDSDNGTALRLRAPHPNDLTADLALGAVLFPDLGPVVQLPPPLGRGAGGEGTPRMPTADSLVRPCPEVLWLLGPAQRPGTGLESRAAREAGPVLAPPSSVLVPGAGLAVLRSPDGKLQVEFDCGPQGYATVSTHGHADALSVNLWRGRDRLIDAGTYRYNGAEAWRNAFRSTAFHNTVTVDGLSQAVPASPSGWLTVADAVPDGSFFSPEFDWIRGRLPAGKFRPWAHTREVLRVGSRIVIVLDIIESRGRHTASAYFHCGRAHISANGRRAGVSYSDGAAMSIFGVNEAAQFEVLDHAKPVPAWQSRFYGAIEPSATLEASAGFNGRIALPWVISLDCDAVKATPAATRGAFAVELTADGNDYLFVMPAKLDVVHAGSVRFVGRWALVEFRGGRFIRAWCALPWALEYAGKRLFTRIGGREFAFVSSAEADASFTPQIC